MMLSYVKFGEIKYGEEPLSDERIQTIFGLLPEMDQALINPSGKDRWKVVNLILIRCWDSIKDYIELYKKDMQKRKLPVPVRLQPQKDCQKHWRHWQAHRLWAVAIAHR